MPISRTDVDGSWISTGMQPFVSRDLMQFPVAIPGEGLIDVVVQSNVRDFVNVFGKRC